MKGNLRRVFPLAVLVALSVTALFGCPRPGNSLCVINNAGTELLILNVYPYEPGVGTNRVFWGPDQVPGALPWQPGTSGCANTYCVTDIPMGMYDLRAVFNTAAAGGIQGNLEVFRFQVPFGPTSWEWVFTLEDVPGTGSPFISDQLTQD